MTNLEQIESNIRCAVTSALQGLTEVELRQLMRDWSMPFTDEERLKLLSDD